MTKNQLPLLSQLQRAVICHQRTKIGGDREDWHCQKLGVLGQVIVIFAKKLKIETVFIFLLHPSWSFLDETSYPRAVVAPALE